MFSPLLPFCLFFSGEISFHELSVDSAGLSKTSMLDISEIRLPASKCLSFGGRKETDLEWAKHKKIDLII